MACFGTKRKKQEHFTNADIPVPATLEELLAAIDGINHSYEDLKQRKISLMTRPELKSFGIGMVNTKKKIDKYLDFLLD
jgi:hypothetical protein